MYEFIENNTKWETRKLIDKRKIRGGRVAGD